MAETTDKTAGKPAPEPNDRREPAPRERVPRRVSDWDEQPTGGFRIPRV